MALPTPATPSLTAHRMPRRVDLASLLDTLLLAAWSADSRHVLWQHLWMLAGLALLVGLTVLASPLYHRWYRHMRRAGADRSSTRTYPPPAPEQAWAGGEPDLHPLEPAESAERREP